MSAKKAPKHKPKERHTHPHQDHQDQIHEVQQPEQPDELESENELVEDVEENEGKNLTLEASDFAIGPTPIDESKPTLDFHIDVMAALNDGKIAWREIWTDGGYIKLKSGKLLTQHGKHYASPEEDVTADDWNVGNNR